MAGVVSDLRERLFDVEKLANKAQADIDKHEEVCAERYLNINHKLETQSGDLAHIKDILQSQVDRYNESAWSLNWKAWALVGGVVVVMLGGMAWMGGQLYDQEPLRVQAQSHK